jgi:hypothetical protein
MSSAGQRSNAAVVTVVVTAHLLVNAAHGLVHWVIPVALTPFQFGYVLVVVGCGPLVALRYARRGSEALAGAVLAASMVGSLLFGVAFHFVLSTPDHVHAVPVGAWHVHFEWTAVASAIVDAVGAVVGVRIWRA